MAIETRQLFNFIQGSDITGESSYDIWKRLGNTGSEADFLEFLRSGPRGEAGESTFDIWKGLGNEGTAQDFIDSLKGDPGEKGESGEKGTDGQDGTSAYDVWKSLGNEGTEEDFINYLKGTDGQDGNPGEPGKDGADGQNGASVYDVWKSLGNEGTEEDFINSLKGEKGEPGESGADGQNGVPGEKGEPGEKGADGTSAYDIWKSLGNEGSEQDFINSLKGEKGEDGQNGNPGEPGQNGEDGQDGASAYDIWKSLGNSGTEQDFINSLKDQGIDSLKINTISVATDLNTITTPGFYRCAASSIAGASPNSPVSIAFFMIVGTHAGVYQELIEYRTANFRRYMRNFYYTWSEWVKVYTSNDKPTAADIGFTASTTDIDNATKGNYNAGVCGTAADVVAKTVTMSTSNFVLKTGVKVYVKFNNGSTVTSPTLNVNSTGAFPIVYTSNTSPIYINGGIFYEFQYTGSSWLLIKVFDYNVMTSGRNYERYGFIFNGDTLKPLSSSFRPSLGANTNKINNIFATNLGSADYPTDNIFGTNIGSAGKKVNNIYAANLGTSTIPVNNINFTNLYEVDVYGNRNRTLLPKTLLKGKFYIHTSSIALPVNIPSEYVRLITSGFTDNTGNTGSSNNSSCSVSYNNEGYIILRLIGMDLKQGSNGSDVMARPFVLYAVLSNSSQSSLCGSFCSYYPNAVDLTTPQGYVFTIRLVSMSISSNNVSGDVTISIGTSAYNLLYFFQIDVL